MTRADFLKKCAEMKHIIIHEAVKKERVGVFQPPLSRHYDRGIATLKDGRKVEIAWGGKVGNLSMESVEAIHALQPEREFVKIGSFWDGVNPSRDNYAPVLFESEK